MAKFNEILSGIAKDFVQLQVASDLASIEAFNRYQNSTDKNEENLRFLDIPRFTVSDVKMSLKFAIAGVSAEPVYSKKVVDKTNDAWHEIVDQQIILNVINAARTLTAADKKNIEADLKKANSFARKSRPEIKSFVTDPRNETLSHTTNYVVNYFKNLPEAISAKLKLDASFQNSVTRMVNAVYEQQFKALREVADSETVVERNLEIIINKDELEKIDNNQVHEISFNLTPDFIKLAKEDNLK
jgi:hypothetical protein